jgi:hypothetical protein
MGRVFCIIAALLTVLVHANPIFLEAIHEFQVAPSDSERFELRYFVNPTSDTLFTHTYDLLDAIVTTPGGEAYIDTDMTLGPQEHVLIDQSMLSGYMWLPNDTGHVSVFIDDAGWFPLYDSVIYPGHVHMWPVHAPAPPAFFSAAKFYCYVYDSSWLLSPYSTIEDWYIDSTPTFGEPNDDYPGCQVAGHVYNDTGVPLADARVIATAEGWGIFFHPDEYFECCTTYTLADGSYTLNNLLPVAYYIEVFKEWYPPEIQLTDALTSIMPITDFDFYLATGIQEYSQNTLFNHFMVYPNPVRHMINIQMSRPATRINFFDVSGILLFSIDNTQLHTHVSADITELPKGIYFIAAGQEYRKIVIF